MEHARVGNGLGLHVTFALALVFANVGNGLGLVGNGLGLVGNGLGTHVTFLAFVLALALALLLLPMLKSPGASSTVFLSLSLFFSLELSDRSILKIPSSRGSSRGSTRNPGFQSSIRPSGKAWPLRSIWAQ